MRKARILSVSLLMVLVLLIGMGAAACGGGNGEEAGASNRFSELLGLIPATMESPVYVVVIDYALFLQVSNISFSTPEEYINAMDEDVIGRQLIGSGNHITGNGGYTDRSTIVDKYVGYNLTDVDAEIQAGNQPLTMVAAIGSFSPQATEDALSHQDEWPTWVIDAYTTEEYGGVTIHSWGDGREVHVSGRFSPPHLDELGRARPLAVTEEYLFSAALASDVESMIDAAWNDTDSLADIAELAIVADEMTALGVWATLIGYADILGYEDPSYPWEIDDSEPRLKRFMVFGSGIGVDEKGLYTAIVLVCESADDAQENSSLLEQRIENGVSITYREGQYWNEIITDSEIRVEGDVLIAKLYSLSWSFWLGWVWARDNLLLYEF